ncbi:MmcQ/YjbR family DNA-binding protein [Pontibacter ramchanderi]|uniref:Putative DNA-binding protein (MmcQ/YjbR family) n=1 Tax=Pontibacter ramchanderi TaxID=1179743 RepID=A0A2N3V159_9BACT|nr:MmcQ/YjbR family DNA-binding protein [Pontibacter ramchanderi]PKV75369.1 putative DNA-binding protein (MmcQ/YjbR family) [Pontibacter ramchanderi]
MNIEELRSFCLNLKGVTEDVKWGNDLCFLVGNKMFCVTSLDGEPSVSFKVTDAEFDVLSTSIGIVPAPYMARNKWIQVQSWERLSRLEWENYVKQSYELVKAKLTKKLQREIEESI